MDTSMGSQGSKVGQCMEIAEMQKVNGRGRRNTWVYADGQLRLKIQESQTYALMKISSTRSVAKVIAITDHCKDNKRTCDRVGLGHVPATAMDTAQHEQWNGRLTCMYVRKIK